MQQEGKPRFLKFHQGSVRGVAFNPKDRYLFCSGACDGKVNLYSALRMELLMCYQITTMSLARNVNAVRFTSDGCRILAGTSARRLAVIDVERGEQLIAYDNCAYNGRDRSALAADPICPYMAVTVCVNGKGITLFDLRMPLPLDFMYDLHDAPIRDLLFLHSSWPWSPGIQGSLMSASTNGQVKISSLDGRLLHSFNVDHKINSICPTPEVYGSSADDGFFSHIMCAGEQVTSYVPEVGLQEQLHDFKENQVWKLRYTSNGSLLYAACENGAVRRYRRYPHHHTFLGAVFTHRGEVQDLDISPFDEYLVTASRDRSVGILHLGAPKHGWTEYCELT
ncbi:unnamed protein product [Darwinula stevensoni]|uniref:Uncharacterized protein n=1 Tax=Darwinula stevensoni TaxID=69355 RepID=A0A7R8XC49_9CRUS|nr:unnamed protein product [Darwinula stevensoni]CAG0892186.1 unnamed protein product [Darwinula stevensoni]